LALVLALAPITDDQLRAELARLVPRVAAARRLAFRGPLPARAMSPDAIRRELAAAIAGTPASAEDAILRRLGLLPARADAGALALEAYAAAPLPRYDPLARRLLVPDAPPLEKQELALAHEIAHAIADERFGIRRTLNIAPDGSHQLDADAERARLALIEGDATLATLTFADPRETFLGRRELPAIAAGIARAAADPKATPWTAALARFTHVDGLLFVARFRSYQPWSAVDALWTDPPATTEQVLHPERYDTCEAPIDVEVPLLPELPGVGRPITTAVLGELGIRTWLAKSVSPELAERAATGWGGDRAGIYPPRPAATPDGGAAGPPPDPALAWLTIWDDPADADDFARAAAPIAGVVLERRGEAVALLIGGDDAGPVVTKMLDAWRDHKATKQKADRRTRRPKPAACARERR
jgi:hypothetical protein